MSDRIRDRDWHPRVSVFKYCWVWYVEPAGPARNGAVTFNGHDEALAFAFKEAGE